MTDDDRIKAAAAEIVKRLWDEERPGVLALMISVLREFFPPIDHELVKQAAKNVDEFVEKHGWRKLLNAAFDSAAFWQHHAEEVEDKYRKLVEAARDTGSKVHPITGGEWQLMETLRVALSDIDKPSEAEKEPDNA